MTMQMSLWIQPREGTPRAPSFELSFRPGAGLIPVVRGFVGEFYAKAVPDPDTAHRLALATHELLDNAAKYSLDGLAVLFIEVDLDRGAVSVRTANRASEAQIAALRQIFGEIAAATDASAFYAAAMRRTAVKKSGSGG